MENEIITLNESLFYGSGLHKKCYRHPDDPALCIKIAYNDEGKKDLDREIAYWKVLKKRQKNYAVLPKYSGPVMTNLGEGQLFELIRNYDGTPCRTLHDFFADETVLASHFDVIVHLLKMLKNEIFENEIITLAIFPHNILMQKVDAETYRIRMVNDMGSPVFFILSTIPIILLDGRFAATGNVLWRPYIVNFRRKPVKKYSPRCKYQEKAADEANSSAALFSILLF